MCRKLADSVSFFYNSAIRKCVCTRQVQQSDLLPFVGYLYFSSSGTAFIGGKDAFSQNRWRWSTTFKPVTDNGWAPGKPDTSAGDECLALNANHEMSWDDYECDRSFSFICERIMA
ncbi:perlucin-like [Saccostrea cucullata]|uniref:perlucin-like n=1 Tax=Saccostrea cuccullata TaxID=36930 RepID=UPI002ED25A2C